MATYKVYKIGRKHGMSGRRQLIATVYSEDEARMIVRRYPDRPRSMVLYTKVKD